MTKFLSAVTVSFLGASVLATTPWANIAAVVGFIGGLFGIVAYVQTRAMTKEFLTTVRDQTQSVDRLKDSVPDELLPSEDV